MRGKGCVLAGSIDSILREMEACEAPHVMNMSFGKSRVFGGLNDSS